MVKKLKLIHDWCKRDKIFHMKIAVQLKNFFYVIFIMAVDWNLMTQYSNSLVFAQARF